MIPTTSCAARRDGRTYSDERPVRPQGGIQKGTLAKKAQPTRRLGSPRLVSGFGFPTPWQRLWPPRTTKPMAARALMRSPCSWLGVGSRGRRLEGAITDARQSRPWILTVGQQANIHRGVLAVRLGGVLRRSRPTGGSLLGKRVSFQEQQRKPRSLRRKLRFA